VISIAIYEQVESLRYDDAHLLSLGLVLFSLVALLITYSLNGRRHVG
jgi:molybdate transport system permease protein